jgi:hypothetical protein
MRRLALCSLAVLALAAAACSNDGEAVLLLVVTVNGSPPPVTALTVTVTGPGGASSRTYDRPNAQAITFPTTLSAELPASATGSVSIAVAATGATGTTVATGASMLTVVASGRPTLYVLLTCGGAICSVDMGIGSAPDGGTTISPRCGNGRVDPGETCDTAIAAGDPGACPSAGCDDGVACTIDTVTYTTLGNACTASCTHEANTLTSKTSDGCCPSAASKATDPDCSATCGDGIVEKGETCDTAIPPGQPGACPTPSECTVADPCAVTLLVSIGTCQAICMHYQVTAQRSGDGCCPPGGTNAVDTDCPAACGDGVRQSTETCDVGIAAPAPGSCPTSCDDDQPSTIDFLSGAGCQATCGHADIKTPSSGDGWCADGATHATDTDCPPKCGNGIVDRGETCDSAATGSGACPQSCPPSPSVCLQTMLTGHGDDCTAACASAPIATCSAVSDGCCPTGCTAATDPDCSSTCGDGVVQSNETCDVTIAAGKAGACPTACDDGDPCTRDLLLSAGTCSAACVHLPVTAFIAGDGCCPPGGDFTVDADCTTICGDGVVDSPVETCDSAIVGSCPTDCPAEGSCTTSALTGSPSTCSASCAAVPITACTSGDGCCPAGCTADNDSDCAPVCGDGVVEAGEACDRAITAGMSGACLRTCDDADACTVDLASGSIANCTRRCTHATVVACLDNDHCCPAGCTPDNDNDCLTACPDGRIEAGETCDPPTTCPTTCPDDGDPCTTELLVGDPAHCNVACRHIPITSCSGSTSDHCCPTGCSSATDSDC